MVLILIKIKDRYLRRDPIDPIILTLTLLYYVSVRTSHNVKWHLNGGDQLSSKHRGGTRHGFTLPR